MDIRTAGTVVTVTAVFLTIVLLVQYRQNRQYAGLGLLASAQAVSLVAFGSALFRFPPGWAGLVAMFSVSATVFSLLLVLAGLTAFLQHRVRWRVLAGFAVFAVIVFAYFILLRPDLHSRRIATYLLVAVVLAALVVTLTRAKRPYAERAGSFMRIVFGLASFFYVGLAVISATRPDGTVDVWAATPFVVLAYLGAVVLMLMWTFGLVFAVAEHLRFDLAQDRENLRQVFQATPDAIAISRMSDGSLVEVNDGFGRLFGLTRDQVGGRAADYLPDWEPMIATLLATGTLRDVATTVVPADGRPIEVEVTGRLLRLRDEPHVITVVRDVTHRLRLERELRRQALTDEMTGLSNRRAFLAALEQQVGTCALVVIDLDGFKQINDSQGHAAGDALVRLFAQVAQSHLPVGGTLGRLGGDEFGALLPHCSVPDAQQWAQQVLDVIHGFTFSAGVAAGGTTIDDVMARADQALYEAKRRGRNCVVCA